MKKTISILCLGVLFIFVCAGVQAKDKKKKKEGVVNIECKLSLAKKKNVFKKGKPIDFILSCSSRDSDLMFIPRRFLHGAADFRPHIVLEDEQGVQYEFLHYRFAFVQKDSTFKALRSESSLYQFRFPDEKGRYRVVEKGSWSETATHSIEERENLFDIALRELPPGKYKAWVDLRHEWKTVKIGRTFMILENYNDIDNRADILSWKISDVTPTIEFEVKDKKSIWGNKK